MDELQQTITCARASSGGWGATERAAAARLVAIDQNHYRTLNAGGVWNSRRVQPPEGGLPPDDPLVKAACAQSGEAGRQQGSASESGTTLDPEFDRLKRDNATAVVALINAAKAAPQVAPAFAACVALHTDLLRQSAPALYAKSKAQSESKSEIAALDRELAFVLQEAGTAAEGVCSWKIVAWQHGLSNFDLAQFESDPALGQRGRAESLARILILQCRQAGDPDIAFSNHSVACATQFATDALAMLRSSDLTDRAYQRLAGLLRAQLPAEMTLFSANAMSNYAWPRYSRDALRAVCGARC
jgi:hypothetical protein